MFERITTPHLAAAAIVAALSAVATADPIVPYTQDFTGANGTQPAGWALLEGTGSIQNNVFEAPRASGTGAVYQGSDAATWSNYTVGSDFFQGRWAASTTQMTGVAARVVDEDNYYAAQIRGSTFRIWREASTGNGGNLVVASTTFATTYPQGRDNPETAWWHISLTVNGTALSASIYDHNDVLVASISGTDSAFAAGAPGVRASVGDQDGALSRWDNFTVSPVPEPVSAALLLGALVALGRGRPSN